MTRVFVDTGGFFAVLVAEDANHAHAARLFGRAKRETWRLMTTNAVVYETHALLVNRVRNGRDVASRSSRASTPASRWWRGSASRTI